MPFGNRSKLTIPAGTHELSVEYVDHDHISYDPPIQSTITVTAE